MDIQPSSSDVASVSQAMDFMFEDVRVRVFTKDGQPVFIADDLKAPLGITNMRQALSRLDDDERGVILNDTKRGPRTTNVVNEFGLYSLILGSRKDEAKVFKRWIVREVIPEIRRTGGYKVRPDSEAPPPSASQAQLQQPPRHDDTQLQGTLAAIEHDIDMLKTFILRGPIRLPVILPGLGRYTVTADYYDTKIVDSRIRTAYLDDDLFKVMRMMAIIEDVTRVYHDTGLREVLLATKSKFPDELDGPIYSAQSLIAWFRDVYRDDIASLCRRLDIDEKARDRRKNWS